METYCLSAYLYPCQRSCGTEIVFPGISCPHHASQQHPRWLDGDFAYVNTSEHHHSSPPCRKDSSVFILTYTPSSSAPKHPLQSTTPPSTHPGHQIPQPTAATHTPWATQPLTISTANASIPQPSALSTTHITTGGLIAMYSALAGASISTLPTYS